MSGIFFVNTSQRTKQPNRVAFFFVGGIPFIEGEIPVKWHISIALR